MGRKKIPGLQKRTGVWVIDKKVFGKRICESTGTSSLEEAERYLVHRLEEIRQANIYGVRPKRMFTKAATKYLLENQHKATIGDDASRLKLLVKHLGDASLDAIHMGTLQPFIEMRRKQGVKARTINHALQIVRRILNLAASEWVDEYGLTWLLVAPKIKLLPEADRRRPYPLNWDEQDKLFQALPPHLARMALFAVNTGCRDQEICRLQWQWEVKAGDYSVFIIPGERVKNGEDRLIVLNNAARSVIESVRGDHPDFVFTYRGKSVTRMLNSAWLRARAKVGLPSVRVHDLKHTFGRRLRATGVSFEDRQDLLGHRSGRITTHYSSAELEALLNAADKACVRTNSGTLLKVVSQNGMRQGHAKVTQGVKVSVV
jgi:integrase